MLETLSVGVTAPRVHHVPAPDVVAITSGATPLHLNERALRAEMLREAVGQAVRWYRAVTRGQPVDVEDIDAVAWLVADGDAGDSFTFVGVCQVLDAEPAALRGAIGDWVAEVAGQPAAKAKRRTHNPWQMRPEKKTAAYRASRRPGWQAMRLVACRAD